MQVYNDVGTACKASRTGGGGQKEESADIQGGNCAQCRGGRVSTKVMHGKMKGCRGKKRRSHGLPQEDSIPSSLWKKKPKRGKKRHQMRREFKSHEVQRKNWQQIWHQGKMGSPLFPISLKETMDQTTEGRTLPQWWWRTGQLGATLMAGKGRGPRVSNIVAKRSVKEKKRLLNGQFSMKQTFIYFNHLTLWDSLWERFPGWSGRGKWGFGAKNNNAQHVAGRRSSLHSASEKTKYGAFLMDKEEWTSKTKHYHLQLKETSLKTVNEKQKSLSNNTGAGELQFFM